METERLKEILHLHLLWLENPKEGCRANLIGANLWRADLSGANLSGANLSGAELRRAYLSGAELRRAKFTVELRDAKDLHTSYYESCQFSLLALNLSFLETVQSST